jgi:hypothetical protein
MTHEVPTGTVAVAWYGRVASGDPVDAAVSLRWQAETCRRALPDDFHIVAWFYDAPALTHVETGPTDRSGTDTPDSPRTGPADIGTGDTWTDNMAARREGGLDELLEAARRPEPGFVAVVCESTDRISRSVHLAARVECELDRAGIILLTAEEGISPGGGCALVGTRQVRAAIADWYLLPMLQRLDADDAHTDPHVRGVLRHLATRTDRNGGTR